MRAFFAVVAGGVFDIVSSGLVGAFIAFIAFKQSQPGAALDAQQFTEFIETNASLRAILVVSGGLVSIAAGYLAAYIAKRSEYLIGALSSFLCVGQGIIEITSGRSTHSVPYMALELLLSPVLGLLGGYLRKRQTTA